jgi:hypothetical protein
MLSAISKTIVRCIENSVVWRERARALHALVIHPSQRRQAERSWRPVTLPRAPSWPARAPSRSASRGGSSRGKIPGRCAAAAVARDISRGTWRQLSPFRFVSFGFVKFRLVSFQDGAASRGADDDSWQSCIQIIAGSQHGDTWQEGSRRSVQIDDVYGIEPLGYGHLPGIMEDQVR